MSHESRTRLSIIIIGLILSGWLLSLVYGGIARALPPGWFAIALLHSLIALSIWRWGKGLRRTPVPGLRPYAPALVVAGGSMLLGWTSRSIWDGAPAQDFAWDTRILAFVLWIPIVEEVIFRYGIGGWSRVRLGPFWGAYLSSVVFALAHGGGAWNQLVLPLGPLLLGLACEWIYAASGRISAAMAFHAACNASAWLFAAFDARWLDWLQALYLKI
jgi:membrane protease YdiL (CAAX protease family)